MAEENSENTDTLSEESPRGTLLIKEPSSEVRFLSSIIEQASTAYSKGELAKSLELYDQAILIDPNNNVLYANRSAILLKLNRVEEAISEATHAIQLDPTWPKVFLHYSIRFHLPKSSI